MILVAMLQQRSYFVLKVLTVPVTGVGVFMWENLHLGYRDLSRKHRNLGNQDSLLLLIWTDGNFYEWKGGELKTRNPSQPDWPG